MASWPPRQSTAEKGDLASRPPVAPHVARTSYNWAPAFWHLRLETEPLSADLSSAGPRGAAASTPPGQPLSTFGLLTSLHLGGTLSRPVPRAIPRSVRGERGLPKENVCHQIQPQVGPQKALGPLLSGSGTTYPAFLRPPPSSPPTQTREVTSRPSPVTFLAAR